MPLRRRWPRWKLRARRADHMADKPEPKPSVRAVAHQVDRIERMLDPKQANGAFARAVVDALSVARKPFT